MCEKSCCTGSHNVHLADRTHFETQLDECGIVAVHSIKFLRPRYSRIVRPECLSLGRVESFACTNALIVIPPNRSIGKDTEYTGVAMLSQRGVDYEAGDHAKQ